MSIVSKTYFAKGSVTIDGLNVTMNDVLIMTGAVNDTIIKSLTVINNDTTDSVVYIKRRDASDVVYQTIKIFLPANQSRILWDDFHVLEEGHDLVLQSDSNDTEVIVSCYEGVSVIPIVNTNGLLTVSITGAAGQWSVDGGTTWNDSGDELLIEADDYMITFSAVEGYVTPSNQSATVSVGETTTIYAVYTEAIAPDATALTVTIYGAAGQWSIDSGTNWNNSGVTLTPAAGDYTITFSAVEGYTAPANKSVTVSLGIAVNETASYTSEITPGTAMLYLLGDTDTLVADNVNTENSGGITDNFGDNVVIVNGAMIAAMPNDIRTLDFGNNWVDVSGFAQIDSNDDFTAGGLAVNTDGKLYMFQIKTGNVVLQQFGEATDWVSVDSVLFATNSSGSIYTITGNDADGYTLVKIGDNLTVLAYGFLFSSTLVMGNTNYLYFIKNNTLVQISSGKIYTVASSSLSTLYSIDSVVYLIDEDGKLYALYDNTNYGQQNYTYSFSITQIGAATNWVNVVGVSSRASGTTMRAWALNSDGELFALTNRTLTSIGTGFSGAKMTKDYILKTDGTLYKRNGASSPILLDTYDDWVDLWCNYFALRQPGTGE